MLKQTCGHEARYRASRIVGVPPAPRRDLVTTSSHGVGSLHFYHPEMQETVLAAASEAGVFVERGVTAVEVSPGPVPSVRVRADLGERTYRARLVVGADGRNSACRKWAGFTVNRDPDRMVLAGVLFKELGAPDDATSLFANPERSLNSTASKSTPTPRSWRRW